MIVPTQNENFIVEFKGPFSWLGEADAPSLFDAAIGKESGIYLWAIETEKGFFVSYVGQTGRTFSQRMKEHLREHLAGFYHLYDPVELRKGKRIPVWPGLYDVNQKISLQYLGEKHAELSGLIHQLTRLYRFFFASIKAETRVIERIEGAIANYLYKQDGDIGNFQEKGIRYRPRWNSELPIWASINSEKNIVGLPREIEI